MRAALALARLEPRDYHDWVELVERVRHQQLFATAAVLYDIAARAVHRVEGVEADREHTELAVDPPVAIYHPQARRRRVGAPQGTTGGGTCPSQIEPTGVSVVTAAPL